MSDTITRDGVEYRVPSVEEIELHLRELQSGSVESLEFIREWLAGTVELSGPKTIALLTETLLSRPDLRKAPQ